MSAWMYFVCGDKYMIIKDTQIEGEGNKKYRLEIGIDISQAELTDAQRRQLIGNRKFEISILKAII